MELNFLVVMSEGGQGEAANDTKIVDTDTLEQALDHALDYKAQAREMYANELVCDLLFSLPSFYVVAV